MRLSVAILARGVRPFARSLDAVNESNSIQEVGITAMKKLLLATIGLVALSGSAMAADLPARPYKAPPPVVAPIYDWTGFYIGANGGWAQSRSCLNFFDGTGLINNDFNDICLTRSGGIIGGQLGYRWQAGTWVFGLEAQGDWADLKSDRVLFADPTFRTGIKTDGIGLFTGQIGYTWGPALLYVKGGGAVVNTKATLTSLGNSQVLAVALPAFVASASETRWGGTVGVGFEYLFTPNWSVGVEYDHLFMGDRNDNFSCGVANCSGFFNTRIKQDLDMVTLRLNYKFGGYGPVVAKY
jgi:outer membrane immunogenic protein